MESDIKISKIENFPNMLMYLGNYLKTMKILVSNEISEK